VDQVEAVRRYHAALNDFDLDTVAEMFSPDAEYHSPGVGILHGRDAIMAAFRRYFADYSDQVAEDDRLYLLLPGTVRAEWRLRATSRSTGRTSIRRGIETVAFDAQGLIRRIDVEDR
jgi:ketosteroid isomerase-like protein